MAWDIEYTHQFGEWWDSLDEPAQTAITRVVNLLEERGPKLAMPYAKLVNQTTRHPIGELRVAHKGRPIRIFYVFDPRRVVILLWGADKGSDQEHFYRYALPKADKLYDEHLAQLRREGLIK